MGPLCTWVSGAGQRPVSFEFLKKIAYLIWYFCKFGFVGSFGLHLLLESLSRGVFVCLGWLKALRKSGRRSKQRWIRHKSSAYRTWQISSKNKTRSKLYWANYCGILHHLHPRQWELEPTTETLPMERVVGNRATRHLGWLCYFSVWRKGATCKAAMGSLRTWASMGVNWIYSKVNDSQVWVASIYFMKNMVTSFSAPVLLWSSPPTVM